MYNDFQRPSVLLISPFSARFSYIPKTENLALEYLERSLKQVGISPRLFDANAICCSSQEITEHVDFAQYDFIGISLSSYDLLEEAVAIANIAKERGGNFVCFGGHFATLNDMKLLAAYPFIDVIVRGDGEAVVPDLVKQVLAKGTLDEIPNLTFRCGGAKKQENEVVRTKTTRIDATAWPTRTQLKALVVQGLLGAAPVARIMSSRGCYARCTFCDIPSFYGPGRWKARPAEDVFAEIMFLYQEYDIQNFRFTDDEFIGTEKEGKKRAVDIAELILRAGIRINFSFNCRAQDVERSLFDLLCAAGAAEVYVGIDSGIDRILTLYKKGANTLINDHAIEVLRDVGIEFYAEFIMLDPRMTYEELVENYEYMNRHRIWSVDTATRYLIPYYGTPVYENLRKEGLITGELLGIGLYECVDPMVGAVYERMRIFRALIDERRNELAVQGLPTDAFEKTNLKDIKRAVDRIIHYPTEPLPINVVG